MGRWLVAILLVVVGASGGYLASEILDDDVEDAKEREDTASGSSEWLFVMTAGSGSLDGATLEMAETHHRVIAFTDRPERETAVTDIETFLDVWTEGEPFAKDPPNADLEMITDGGKRRMVTVELLSVEGSGETLTFEVTELGDQNATGSFDEATLFIDATADDQDACIAAAEADGLDPVMSATLCQSNGPAWWPPAAD